MKIAAPINPDNLIDLPDLSQWLHISRRTIFRLIQRGILKPCRLHSGGHLYFDRAQVVAALKKHPNFPAAASLHPQNAP